MASKSSPKGSSKVQKCSSAGSSSPTDKVNISSEQFVKHVSAEIVIYCGMVSVVIQTYQRVCNCAEPSTLVALRHYMPWMDVLISFGGVLVFAPQESIGSWLSHITVSASVCVLGRLSD